MFLLFIVVYLLALFCSSTHVLNILLLIEMGLLVSSVLIAIFLSFTHLSLLILFLFTLVVCEAALGLSVMIKSVRHLGSDHSSVI